MAGDDIDMPPGADRAAGPATALNGAGPDIRIACEDPTSADLGLLFERHERDMRHDTPPESVHMMPRAALRDPAITFLVMRDAGRAVAMGAFKRIGPDHAEIKSMHVLAEARGGGLSRRMLDAIVTRARDAGIRRLSLETGVQPTFVAARGLYARAGFVECPPFGSYLPDPNSVFMTRTI